jgi:methyl-accepting chemotaxis protein
VEAARAGDAGKGFAVVASEVRALAQRAGDAARDIRARIGSSTEQVSNGVGLVTATGDALERIAASVGEINDVMQRITGTSSEQAGALGQINATVRDVDRSPSRTLPWLKKQPRQRATWPIRPALWPASWASSALAVGRA